MSNKEENLEEIASEEEERRPRRRLHVVKQIKHYGFGQLSVVRLAEKSHESARRPGETNEGFFRFEPLLVFRARHASCRVHVN